jgi:CSLREA domain-containing protein
MVFFTPSSGSESTFCRFSSTGLLAHPRAFAHPAIPALRTSRSLNGLVLILGLYTISTANVSMDAIAEVKVLLNNYQAVFTVNSTADLPDGNIVDGKCDTALPGQPPSNVCTLRAALTEAEQTPAADTIVFNIPMPGGGVPKIIVNGSLGSLGAFSPVTVDGTTQPGGGLAGSRVELDGSTALADPGGVPLSGFVITGSNITLRGLVINGFLAHGIYIHPSGSLSPQQNVIEQNFIGTDSTGTQFRGNGGHGILIQDATKNTIGGIAGKGNLISGNHGDGIHITGALSVENTIRSNRIGTEVNGNFGLGNFGNGIYLAASNNFIGITSDLQTIEGNRIHTNVENGILITGAAVCCNFISGNKIGAVLPTGVILGNGGHGVLVDGAGNNIIGNRLGGLPNAGNDIHANQKDGVRITGLASNGNSIRLNSIVRNGLLGIDLGGDGVTRNDIGDTDAGPNTLLNFPETFIAGGAVIGSLTGSPPRAFTLDFFSNTACDASGFGEGETYIGSVNVVGDAPFTFTPPAAAAGLFITVTTTDGADNTSEFSQCIRPSIPPPPPPVCPTVVTTTSDNGPGSFRQALICANARAGQDTISFNIPGSGAHTIASASALPVVTDPVIIDGYTQPGSTPNNNPLGQPSNAVLKVELNGVNAGLAVDGIVIVSGGSTVRGLVINRFGGNGIVLRTAGSNVIEGNFIGADVSGATSLGNVGHGVAIDGSADNRVGAPLGNLLRGNGRAGVAVKGAASDRNAIRGNFMLANTGLGIDLGDNGVTANDLNDLDTGPNEETNFPEILSAANSPSGTAIDLRLNSTPATNFVVEFFSNHECDPLGQGEGELPVGYLPVITDATGNASLSAILPVVISSGRVLTATAMNGANTSEFSQCRVVMSTAPGALAQISALIEAVRGLAALNAGHQNSLISKLNAALRSVERGNPNAACGQLGAFINQLNALAHESLDVVTANSLIKRAEAVTATIGCRP